MATCVVDLDMDLDMDLDLDEAWTRRMLTSSIESICVGHGSPSRRPVQVQVWVQVQIRQRSHANTYACKQARLPELRHPQVYLANCEALVCRKLIYLLGLPIFQTGGRGRVVAGEKGVFPQFCCIVIELPANEVLWIC